MKTRNKALLVIVAILALFPILGENSSVKAANRDQGPDWSKYQGYSGAFGYGSDKFAIAQIGGTYGGTLITQATYNSQVASARNHGLRAHTYIWYGVGSSITNGRAGLNYFLPRVKTPKGSIVALDYEDGASGSKSANTAAILYGMRRIAAAGYTPMYYSYKPYTLSHVNYQSITKEFPNSLWIAAYPNYLVTKTPPYGMFPSLPGVAIWQFTSTYRAGGLDGNVDLTGITKNGYSQQPSGTVAKAKKASYFKSNPGRIYTKTKINRYKDKGFKHQVDGLPKHTVIDVKSVVTYGKITRFKLANGYYITSNKASVNNLYYTVKGGVKQVKSVSGTNRYKDIGLKHKLDHWKAGTKFDVVKTAQHGKTTRLQLSNGNWISGSKLVNNFVK